jgi:hypothetical protein
MSAACLAVAILPRQRVPAGDAAHFFDPPLARCLWGLQGQAPVTIQGCE